MHIPIVSAATVETIFAEYAVGDDSWGERLTEFQGELLDKQPALVKFIENLVGKYPPSMHSLLFEMALAPLLVLDIQAEADEMEKLS